MDKMEIGFITKKIDMAKSQINDIVKGKEDVVEKIWLLFLQAEISYLRIYPE